MSLFRIWQQVPVVAIHSAIIRRYFATRTKTIRRFTVCLNSLEVVGAPFLWAQTLRNAPQLNVAVQAQRAAQQVTVPGQAEHCTWQA
jgi:hypothetical protein